MKVSELFEAKERSVLSVMGKQPEHYPGNFFCSRKNLTSLKGAPSSVGGDFDCYNNVLTSLEGGPSFIGGNFYCYKNNLTSLHNIYKQIKHIGGFATFNYNPIKSHVLGLLLIEGLTSVRFDNLEVTNIINKHLKGDRDVFACQEELIEAGLEDFAQL
jgi:hypothetical protein